MNGLPIRKLKTVSSWYFEIWNDFWHFFTLFLLHNNVGDFKSEIEEQKKVHLCVDMTNTSPPSEKNVPLLICFLFDNFFWRIIWLFFFDKFFDKLFFWRIFFDNYFDEFLFFSRFCLTYNLLTIASFRIGVPSILFVRAEGPWSMFCLFSFVEAPIITLLTQAPQLS